MVDWKAMIAYLTGKTGWEEAEGPDSGVGVSYWYGEPDDDDGYVRVDIDQGYATLTRGGNDYEETLWSGEVDTLSDDENLGRFVTSTPAP